MSIKENRNEGICRLMLLVIAARPANINSIIKIAAARNPDIRTPLNFFSCVFISNVYKVNYEKYVAIVKS